MGRSLHGPCLGSRRATSRAASRRGGGRPWPDWPGTGSLRRIRFPDRGDIPCQPQRGPRGRGADRVRRPTVRCQQDVAADHLRGVCRRPHSCAGRSCAAGRAARALRLMARLLAPKRARNPHAAYASSSMPGRCRSLTAAPLDRRIPRAIADRVRREPLEGESFVVDLARDCATTRPTNSCASAACRWRTAERAADYARVPFGRADARLVSVARRGDSARPR